MIEKIKSNLFASFFLSKAHFARRYKRFHLGVFWTFFPTILVLIGAYVSSKQLDLESFGFKIHYVGYVIIPFIVFRSITETFDVSQKLIQLSFILQRSLNIKSHQIIAACLMSSFFHLSLDIITAIIILTYFHESLSHLSWLYFIFIFYSVFIGVFISIILGPVCMLIYDLRFISKFLRVIILACTPIFYIIPKDGIVYILNKFNPFTKLITSSRDVVFYGLTHDVKIILFIIPVTIIIFILSLKLLEKQIKIINSTPVKGVVGQTYAWNLIFKTPLSNDKSK